MPEEQQPKTDNETNSTKTKKRLYLLAKIIGYTVLFTIEFILVILIIEFWFEILFGVFFLALLVSGLADGKKVEYNF